MANAADMWVKRTRGVFIAAVILVIAALLGGAAVSYLSWQQTNNAGEKAEAEAAKLPSLDQAAADADHFSQSSLDRLSADRGSLAFVAIADPAMVSGTQARIASDQSAYDQSLANMAVAKARALGARAVLGRDRSIVATDAEQLHWALIWSGLALLLAVLLAVAAFLSATKARATVALRREGILST